jgi:ubiquinone/menaquinone biosynthesis C-methylase UbiE
MQTVPVNMDKPMLNATIKQKIKNTLPKPIFEALLSLKYWRKKVPHYEIYIDYVAGKKGIEIGGPSILFKTSLPLYQKIQSLDGVNFSEATVWEGKIRSGLNYNFVGNRKGIQFVSDATHLSEVKDSAYDFLLSSNCLEHIANPIKALMEWKRVVKSNGYLILVLPNKASNFDHQRPTTSFDHIVEDFVNNITEYDLTHIEEILKLHDLSMDPPAGNIDNFKTRSLDNYNNRTLHHHVFDLSVMASMLEYCGFDIIQRSETTTDFVMLAIKKI